MSEENLELTRRAWKAFEAGMARGDPGGAFDSGAVAPDFEWVPPRGFPGASVYRGREGFAEFMAAWTEDFDNLTFRLDRLIDAGDNRVVGLFHQAATGKGSGVPVELDQGIVYEFEGGHIVRMRNYVGHAEALEAGGLSE
jgi:ketosteroid isomerase-like protein